MWTLFVFRNKPSLKLQIRLPASYFEYRKTATLASISRVLRTAAGLEKLRDRKFGEVSGGQRQRTLFALAICGNPDLLFLDEPTAGLDVEARRALREEFAAWSNAGKLFCSPHTISKRPTLSPTALP
jgi:ABC-type multidrug transport system ATPase subunit